jgi:hypothetical protein
MAGFKPAPGLLLLEDRKGPRCHQAEAATEIETARADFATGLAVVTAQMKDVHTRRSSDIQVSSAGGISNKAPTRLTKPT